MRAHHAIAVVAIILIGLGVKLFFFPAPAAEADTSDVLRPNMNVIQMHKNHPNMKNVPVQKMHDMTFVFSESD
jgi:hypothetical protein